MSIKRNTAITGFVVGLVSATDGSAITTGTPVGYYTLDGGTQTAIGDVTPVHEGNGQWSFDLTAAEMNGIIVGLVFVHASAIPAHFTIKTDTKIVSELQDLTAAQVNTEADTALTDYGPNTVVPDAAGVAPTAVEVRQEIDTNSTKSGYALSATGLDLILAGSTAFIAIAKAVWDRVISKANHDIGQSAGKVLRQGSDLVQIDGSISDTTPSVTNFDTNLTQVDGYFDDAVLIFSNGSANAGIGRPVVTHLNANGNMAFVAPDDWPVTPVDGDDFVIFANHVHPVTQIQSGLATEAKQDIIDANLDLVLADTANMQPKLGTPAADLAADVAAVKVDTAAILIDTAAPKKNTAFPNLPVFMVDSTDNVTPETGLTLSVTRSIDGGAFGAATGSAAEIGNGAYQFDASAADMNGDVIIFRLTSAGAADSLVTVHTRP